MNRMTQFVNEYIGMINVTELDIDQQAELLLEMVKDLLVEDRLRTMNLLSISGTTISESQKASILKGAADGF